jgi:diguanylate cyclase (GGDEF)-like protein
LLTPTYNVSLVILSLVVASFASFMALDLSQRVRAPDAGPAHAWLIGAALALGTGSWAMHFIGMLAFSLPVPLGYDPAYTLASWIVAVAVSWGALGLASRVKPGRAHLACGGVLLGGGLSAMHYIGMYAMQMMPAIVWDGAWVLASVVIAILAATGFVGMLNWLREKSGLELLGWQVVTALFMGFGVAGLHYTAMQAASFPLGSICRAAGSLTANGFGLIVGGAAMSLLGVSLFMSTLDARLRSRTAILTDSLRQANVELQRIAFLDSLTQLPNRILLSDRLSQAVSRSRREANSIALLFVDLDGFKQVNDTLGHQVGDRVLKEMASRLSQLVRASDTVARFGGDEFVVLVDVVEDRTGLAILARRIQAEVSAPLTIKGDAIALSASIGIAVFPDDAQDEKQLLDNADAAMYAAKAAGKNAHRFHDPAATVSTAGSMIDLRDLRGALERGEFELFYEPKMDRQGEILVGVEALIRWRHPRRGLVGPAEFIAIAERFGLILTIGRWVIDDACRQIRAWRDLGWRIPVAINLSLQQLRQPGLASQIEAGLLRHGVPASQLTLELTEASVMDSAEQSLLALMELHRIGVRIAVDDFGTGYSSLAYLRRFPIDELKIDRIFVHELERSEDARAIVTASINLAHSLNLNVIAEGVESLRQKEILGSMACDVLQGHLFSLPMRAGELTRNLLEQRFAMPTVLTEFQSRQMRG